MHPLVCPGVETALISCRPNEIISPSLRCLSAWAPLVRDITLCAFGSNCFKYPVPVTWSACIWVFTIRQQTNERANVRRTHIEASLSKLTTNKRNKILMLNEVAFTRVWTNKRLRFLLFFHRPNMNDHDRHGIIIMLLRKSISDSFFFLFCLQNSLFIDEFRTNFGVGLKIRSWPEFSPNW